MDILAWSDSSTPGMVVGGWVKDDKNWQSADTIREEGGVLVEKGEPNGAGTHMCYLDGAPILTAIGLL